MCKCPSCQSRYRKRLTRRIILKMIPKARAYKCYHCKAKYLKIPFIEHLFILKQGYSQEVSLIE